jgi:pyrrolidone-carboxylate peptidase
MGGFIHVPPCVEMQQASSEWKGMPLEAMLEALTLAIEICTQHNKRG